MSGILILKIVGYLISAFFTALSIIKWDPSNSQGRGISKIGLVAIILGLALSITSDILQNEQDERKETERLATYERIINTSNRTLNSVNKNLGTSNKILSNSASTIKDLGLLKSASADLNKGLEKELILQKSTNIASTSLYNNMKKDNLEWLVSQSRNLQSTIAKINIISTDLSIQLSSSNMDSTERNTRLAQHLKDLHSLLVDQANNPIIKTDTSYYSYWSKTIIKAEKLNWQLKGYYMVPIDVQWMLLDELLRYFIWYVGAYKIAYINGIPKLQLEDERYKPLENEDYR